MIVIRNQNSPKYSTAIHNQILLGRQTLKESLYRMYYHCCFAVMFLHLKNKLKLVMKGIELELWIASLTKWNFITVQSSR